jgi:hypothetical protein
VAAHGRRVPGGDIGPDVHAVDLLMRELPDEAARVPAARGPSGADYGYRLLIAG